ncbi:major facilitator superfamily MFS-1 [Wallemia mellicola]|uniref:Major facilitator superfamily MFS-1 n=1 Tax=Wallemia mellicola TaxID=1708541 RepID=A0A4T0M9N7_9BASI|nr:major facilitator superfamily MFS-1 [Wallemia mellicola]
MPLGRKLGESMVFSQTGVPIKAREEPSNPLPIVPLSLLSLSMLSEFLSASVAAPFIFVMVSKFSITHNDESLVGYYTGILGAAFFLSQFVTALMWSNIADRYGRRVTLFVSLFGNALATSLFGTCQSLGEAICVRMLQGLFSGAVGVSRSAVKDITDSTNEAKAYAILSFSWGAGSIFGPIIGGIFESPTVRYPGLFPADKHPFFDKYPYALPCFVAASVLLFGSSLTALVNRDGGSLFNSISLPDNSTTIKERIVTFFKSFKSGQLNEETPISPLQDIHSRYPSYIESDGQAESLRQPQPKQSRSFAQRLLLAQEENVVSITDLWVQSALTREVERYNHEEEAEDIAIEEEGEQSGLGSPNPSGFASHYEDDDDDHLDNNTIDLTNPSERDVEELSSSASIRPSASTGFRNSFRRSSAGLGFSRPSSLVDRGDRLGEENLAKLGSVPRIHQLGMTAARPKSILDNVGLSSQKSWIGLDEQFDDLEGGSSRLGAIPEQNQPAIIEEKPVEMTLMIKLILFQYSFLALHNTTFDQLFTTFLLTDYTSGGLSLTPSHFSTLIAMMAGINIFYQFYLYGKIGPPNGQLTHLQMFRIASLIYIMTYGAVPFVRKLARPESESDLLVMSGLAILTAIRYAATTAAYTSITILINVMSPPSISGLTNSYGQSAVSLSRFLGPIFGGYLWKTFLTGDIDGYRYAFWLVSVMAVILNLAVDSESSTDIPNQLNTPREPRQPPAGERENQIKMTNVHYEISEEMLGNIFNGYQVTKLRIRYDKSGRSTGEAIVAFESSEDADRAIEEFNGKTAKDQIINVEPYGYFTVDPPSHAGASSGDNAGSLLSRLGSKVNPGPVPTGPRAQISRRSVKQSKPKKAGFNKPKPAPKDADSLDKELDEFMKKPTENDNTEDTEMS